MRILFATFHPADPQIVQFVIKKLIINGHKVLFTVVEKENIINNIVNSYNIPSKVIGKNKTTLLGKIFNTLVIDLKLFLIIKRFKPDIIFSPSSPYVSFVLNFIKTPLLSWADTETAVQNLKYSTKRIDSLLIPNSFYKILNSDKVIRFNGYKEIAYLHPNYFKPDIEILSELFLSETDKIVLMRFSALNAMHDIGLKSEAITNADKILNFIKRIENKYAAKVFISVTERNLDKRFDKYKLTIAPAKYIHLLSFCSLYIGEGTTTASEAGVLGIPWINIQKTKRGYLIDQEKKYGLGIRSDNIEYAFQKAEEFLSNDNIKTEWQKRRKKLLADKIDVSAFLAWFITNYPQSHKIMKENPDYQNKFK